METKNLEMVKKENAELRNQNMNLQNQTDLESQRAQNQKAQIDMLRDSKYKGDSILEGEQKLLKQTQSKIGVLTNENKILKNQVSFLKEDLSNMKGKRSNTIGGIFDGKNVNSPGLEDDDVLQNIPSFAESIDNHIVVSDRDVVLRKRSSMLKSVRENNLSKSNNYDKR